MKKRSTNPFYILLLVAGCAFAVTACAYGVMTVRQLHRSREEITEADRFSEAVDQHGARIMLIELVLLGVGTFGAIAYDQHLDGKNAVAAKTMIDERTAEEER